MADEGFHEIQLNGKQLISLFMIAAVVLGVTFVCGVMVGRGVRAQKESAVAGEMLSQGASGAVDPTAGVAALQPQAGATPQQPPASAPPSPPDEDSSYYSRLQDKGTPVESPKAGPKAKDDPKAKDVPAAVSVPPKPVAPAGAASGEPTGPGYSLKIVAYRDRGQADALASRLSGKGYSTYVVALSGKGPVLYSVRVGKFKTRREADVVRGRLEREEQFKPLITR